MAQIKISELPTLAQQLQAANFVPVIHSGTTYKISLFNYLVKNSGDETIAGVKTFSSSPIVPTATTSTQAVNYGQVVKNTGNETIAGTKTFSTSPIVPTPSYDSDTTVPATTAWVTDRIEGLTVDCTSRVAEYTGDGGGSTVKDRAGNGNNLTATNITYVNGKYCKEMSFNGSSSYAQASSPVIGTTGTVAVRFRINSTSATYFLFDTRNSSTYLYGMALAIINNTLSIRFAGSTEQSFNLAYGIGTGYRTVEIAFDTSNIYFYLDGVLVSTTAITSSGFTHTNNLLLGKGQITSTPAYLNGIISHFRYDSRIWTADEARAWSLNPISIDSRV